jgi:hypothetical protein
MDDGKEDSHATGQMDLQVITGLKNIGINAFCHRKGLKRLTALLQGTCPA